MSLRTTQTLPLQMRNSISFDQMSARPPLHFSEPCASSPSLLELLPSLHSTPTDHREVLRHLVFLVHNTPSSIKPYLSNICYYIKQNLENNVQIIASLEFLVALHPHLTLPLRSMFSSLLRSKYPHTSFRKELNKLSTVNHSLVELFLWLLSLIAQWHQLQISQSPFYGSRRFELLFLLDYSSTILEFEFESGQQLQGLRAWQPLISIYSLLEEDIQLFKSLQDHELRQLAYSLFHFMATAQISDLPNVKVVFTVVSNLIEFIEQRHISFEKEVTEHLFSAIRNRKVPEVEQLIEFVQNAARGVLSIGWSHDTEARWMWLCKAVWDLLDIEPKEQFRLLKELADSTKQMIKYHESC